MAGLFAEQFGFKTFPVLRAWNAAMPSLYANRYVPLHDPSFPLVLVFSPKSGSTALVKWFFFQLGKLEEAETPQRLAHYYRRKVFIARTGYRAKAVWLMAVGSRPIVKLVRDPYDRAVSSFLHTLAVGHENNPSPWAAQLIRAARARAGKPPAAGPMLSFRDFMRYVASNGADIVHINSHVAQQFVPAERGRIARLLKLEAFKEGIRGLEAEYGLRQAPLELLESPHHRKGFAVRGLEGASCAADLELTRRDVRVKDVPSYQLFYDEETRELVASAYAADFEAYGYRV